MSPKHIRSPQSEIGVTLSEANGQKSAIAGGCIITAYRTYKGKKLGPYYFRKWKVGRKVYKQYIKPEDVEKVRAACAHTRQRRREINRLIDNFEWLRKMNLWYDRGKKARPDQEAYILRLHNEGMHITGRPPFRPRRLTVLQRLVKIHDAVCDWLFANPQTAIGNCQSKAFGAPIFSKFVHFVPSRTRQDPSPMRPQRSPQCY